MAHNSHWCTVNFPSFSKSQSNKCFWSYHLQNGHDTKLSRARWPPWRQGKRQLSNVHHMSTSHCQGICYSAGRRMSSLTGLAQVCILPELRPAQCASRTGCSALPTWETNTNCGAQCRGAVGGQWRTSGRGKGFPLTDRITHCVHHFKYRKKKGGHPCSKGPLCYKDHALYLCASSNSIWQNKF